MAIEGLLEIPDQSSAANLIVALNGAEYEVLSKKDGSFRFPKVPSGIYAVDVLSVNHSFPSLKIKVNAQTKVVNVVEYIYPGAKRTQAEYPLYMRALYPVKYYEEHPPLSIIGMITGNPMMLMMVISLVVMIAFPQLLKGLDPEELKRMQEEMGSSGDPVQNMKKMVGIDDSGANNDEDE